jgi:hypothetical protein
MNRERDFTGSNGYDKEIGFGPLDFPFGGGPRVCIGAQFATIEATLVLATVARQYEMELVTGHPVVPDPTFTLRTKHGVRVVLRRRGRGTPSLARACPSTTPGRDGPLV